MNTFNESGAAAVTTTPVARIAPSKVIRTSNNLLPVEVPVKLSEIPFWDRINRLTERYHSEREIILFSPIIKSTISGWGPWDKKKKRHTHVIKTEFEGLLSFSPQRILLDLKEFIGWAREVNQFLDVDFVLQKAPKYGIKKLNFEDPRCSHMDPSWWDEESWKDETIAMIQHIPDTKNLYTIHFNPKIDREKAAKFISKRTRLRIRPEEVFYYAWFHECAHTRQVSGDLCPQALSARCFFIGKQYHKEGPIVTRESLRSLHIEAERKADEWAVKELKKWRQEREQ